MPASGGGRWQPLALEQVRDHLSVRLGVREKVKNFSADADSKRLKRNLNALTFRRAKTHVIGLKDFTFGEILKVVDEEISSRVVRLSSPSLLARRRLGRRRGGQALVARSLCAAGRRRSGERSVHCRDGSLR